MGARERFNLASVEHGRPKNQADLTNMQNRIYLSIPHMGGAEMAFVEDAFRSNWLSTVGPNIDALEEELESLVGRPSVAVSSGTAAIHLGLRLLGVGQGDEVFCSDLTFVAMCNPVRYLGAEPVFVDSDKGTWHLDPNLLEDALRKRAEKNRMPRALVVAHLYGGCADLDPILALCQRYGVAVLEDAAEALGARYRDKPVGTFGDVGVYSLNGNKMITGTGGGILVAPNREWIEKARFWSQQAREPGIGFQHSELGYNYGFSNVLAGIARGQLRVLDQRVSERRAVALGYQRAFADLGGISLMPQPEWGFHTNWLSCFLIDERKFGASRDSVIERLEEANVESRPVWKPMHMQPLFAGCERFGGTVAEEIHRFGICLPSSSSLSEKDQLRVEDVVRGAVGAGALARIWDGG
jgi:pyridoxal phosphate-dependent aminotransferase EpsN